MSAYYSGPRVMPAPPPPRVILKETSRADHFAAMKATVDWLRESDALTPFEIRQLDLEVFGYFRGIEKRQERALSIRKVLAFARERDRSLVASMSAPGADTQPWSGVIGAEGSVTGDGRVIQFGALQWAQFPLPLRWAKADVGGHDGAVIVGRIDDVQRRDDGTIWASGLLDLGSDDGQEAARLIDGGFLSGVSMDLDSVDSSPVAVNGKDASMTTSGRVRAATLVAIPAFAEATISLSDGTDDCDCDGPSAPGLYSFAPTVISPASATANPIDLPDLSNETAFPRIDQMPGFGPTH